MTMRSSALTWSAAWVSAVVLSFACATVVTGPQRTVPPAADVESVIYLIGDAGAPDPAGEPVLAALTDDLRGAVAPATVVFLGDNLYPAGLSGSDAPDRREGERRLRAQVEAALDGGAISTLLIPGNHDWNFAGDDGYARILEQEKFVESLDDGSVQFLPDAACPGPAVRDVGSRLRLILLDTEWWLHDAGLRHDDPSCAIRGELELTDSIKTLLAGAAGRSVVVLGHHPLVSGGTHGGYLSLRQHLFPLTEVKSWLWLPLPVLGSAYPLARNLGISNQDLSGARNRHMRHVLREAFASAPPLLYAAGHEHSLQVHEGVGSRYHVVSGTGIYGHTSNARWTDGTLYASGSRSGYMKLEVQRDGRVRLAVVAVDAGAQRDVPFSMFLEHDP